MLFLAFAAPSALGFECITLDPDEVDLCSPSTCRYVQGNSQGYRFRAADFTVAEMDEIDLAAAAWRSGAGRLNRGANWELVRQADHSGWGHNNGHTDVVKEDDAWFADHDNEFIGNETAQTWIAYFGWPACSIKEIDIIFRAEGVNWTTQQPNKAASDETSIGATAVHEFGHLLGLDHASASSAADVMNEFGGSQSDVSGVYRVTEDAYLGLVDAKSDNSTGSNLMISKFKSNGDEVWRADVVNSEDWGGCPGDEIDGTARPAEVYVHLTGTTSLNSVRVRWTLSSNGVCNDEDDVVVGSKLVNLGVNTPYAANLDTWTIPVAGAFGLGGDFFVCAIVDPEDNFTESSGADNSVRSERTFFVARDSICPP